MWWGFGAWSAPFLWVIILIIAESAFLMRCSAYESPGYGMVSVGAFLALFYFMGVFNPLYYIWHHIGWALLFIVGYAFTGLGYARLIKWKFFLSEWVSQNRSFKLEWLSKRGVTGTEVPDELQHEWQKAISEGYSPASTRFDVPNVWNYKRKFFTWVGYWPFSAFWTLINDPFKRFVDWAYHKMMASMQREAERAASEFSKDRDLVKAAVAAQKATNLNIKIGR